MIPLHPAPKVTLLSAPAQPYNTAIAAARTCYSSKVITPEIVGATPASREQRDRIAASTFEAGHHTVFQHAHLTFVLEQVSRQAIWSFLHAHPFYNSEQVSQRYVEVKPGRYTVPTMPEAAVPVFERAVQDMHATYSALVDALGEGASEAFFGVFPARRRKLELYDKDIKKKAQEVARYALPVATHAHLYHSVGVLTLFRYWRLCHQMDVPGEVAALVTSMVDAVKAQDAELFQHLQDPLPLEETLEFAALESLGAAAPKAGHGGDFARTFDAALDGRSSRLVASTPDAAHLVADAVREMLAASPAALGDDAALAMVLDPASNHYLGDTLNLTSLGKLTRALNHATFTFKKKISHTADSQDQRHRMVPGSRPILANHVDLGRVDVIVPPLISASSKAADLFHGCMERVWVAMRQMAELGASSEAWSYLLPNAFPVRFSETGDLMHLHHKWTARLCFTAQEEIWRASVDEVEQVRAQHPKLGAFLLPPCGLRHRAGVTPYCPEGPRYCGVPVWKKDLLEYQRVI